MDASDRQAAAWRALPFAAKDSSMVSWPRDPDGADPIVSRVPAREWKRSSAPMFAGLNAAAEAVDGAPLQRACTGHAVAAVGERVEEGRLAAAALLLLCLLRWRIQANGGATDVREFV